MFTILVVDDEQLLLDLCKRILCGLPDCRVLAASNGDEALELFAQQRDQIDVLVTDVIMDGEADGVRVADHASKICPKTAILLMSGFPSVGRLALRPGWQFLPKPFRPSELAHKVSEILDQRRTPRGRSN